MLSHSITEGLHLLAEVEYAIDSLHYSRVQARVMERFAPRRDENEQSC